MVMLNQCLMNHPGKGVGMTFPTFLIMIKMMTILAMVVPLQGILMFNGVIMRIMSDNADDDANRPNRSDPPRRPPSPCRPAAQPVWIWDRCNSFVSRDVPFTAVKKGFTRQPKGV